MIKLASPGSRVNTRSETSLTVSVVIPTRNRADALVRCIGTVVTSVRSGDEIIVVDQSDDDATSRLLEWAGLLDRVRYVRSDERGVARARNLGASLATGEVVLYSDDDCTVPVDWAHELVAVIAADQRAAIVFAGVVLEGLDEEGAFGADFRVESEVLDGRVLPPSEPWGISANMAVRVDALQALHGFDPELGAGGRLKSAAETDLAIRAINAGYRVLNRTDPVVVHRGARTGEAASELARGYAFGLGAAFAKHARLRSRYGWSLLPRWLWFFSRRAASNIWHGRRPSGVGFLLGLLSGAARGLAAPLDRTTGLFRER